MDTAAIVIDAQSGIGVNTRRLFDEAGKAGLGRVVVINKMDGENIDFEALIGSVQDLWGPACALLTARALGLFGVGFNCTPVVDLDEGHEGNGIGDLGEERSHPGVDSMPTGSITSRVTCPN